MERSVDLETVPPVPVSSVVGESLGFFETVGDGASVVVKVGDAGAFHERVHALALAELGQGEQFIVGFESLLLARAPGREPRSLLLLIH